jgi:hypothetical protein
MSSTWSTDCRTVDPAELESRYSTDDNIEFLEQVLAEEHSDESLGNLERVREIMGDLPAREADFVDLYF